MAGKTLGTIAVRFLAFWGWVYAVSPLFLRKSAGGLLGRFLFALGLRKRIVIENIFRAYPGLEFESFRRKLLKQNYSHLGEVFLELFMLCGSLKRYATQWVVWEGRENYENARALGKGIVYLASHVGNWEIMAAGACLQGADALLVTKKLKPDWLHRAVEMGRASCNVEGTYEPRTMKDILSRLKRGLSVGIVLDQYAGPPIGVRVPLFGIPVGTSTALAAIVRRTGAAVIPTGNYKRPDGVTVVQMRPALEWISDEDPERELALNTAHYVQWIEKDIRAHPEQWLWTHRRFKGDISPLRDDEWSERRKRT